jgi:class 3 adenylate cyclase
LQLGRKGTLRGLCGPPGGGAHSDGGAARLAAHSWPPGAQLRVRMGLHTGRGELGGDNYVGIDVNQAARIAPAGHGGQVLLSEATPVQSARQAGEVRRRGADAA